MVHWPGPYPHDVNSWSHSLEGGKLSLRFAPAQLDPRTGVLSPASAAEATGTMMTLSRRLDDIGGRRVPALPERCPRCDAGGVNRDPRAFFRGTVRSPIRAHTTGVARVNQVLLDRVVRNVAERPQDGRTIVFTDSRDDAAATAAGVEVNHFRDLVRQLSPRSWQSPGRRSRPWQRAAEGLALTHGQDRLLAIYKASMSRTSGARMRLRARGAAESDDSRSSTTTPSGTVDRPRRLSWEVLRQRVERDSSTLV